MLRFLGVVLATVVFCTGTWAGNLKAPTPWVEAARGLPVSAEGRILPLDTWSRVIYARLSGRDNDEGALEWFLTLVLDPTRTETEPLILVNDPTIPMAAGIQPAERGRFSPQQLAVLFPLVSEWIGQFADDTSPEGKERLRLAQALNLYSDLTRTFRFDDARALESPLRSLNHAGSWLNPAQALATEALSEPEKDKLALLLFWRERSLAQDWAEATPAMTLFAGAQTSLELAYNRVPWAVLVALLAGLALLALALRRYSGWPARILCTTAWLVMTAWIIVRIAISGRPPVTNLASTFLLVSFLLLGISVWFSFREEQKTTVRLALSAGALLPFVAMAFQTGSDPFSPLQAVLNTNFWLSIHVTTIVAGYAATFLAGLLGHAYLWTAGNKKGGGGLLPLWNNLRFVLFAGLALTLVGTLLGGVWADQSWGRFWGWDPKENGALLIVLWLALTLHLKPSGLSQEWGTALAAAAAVPVLLFSWLGVNLLGQGFHSYGAAPDKVLWFFASLAGDALVLAGLILRKVLR